MKFGIMQGRLSRPSGVAIQEFPVDWKKEFVLLRNTELCYIDWIVTEKSFKINPLFSEDLKLLPIRSVCSDNLMDGRFFEDEFLRENLEPLCESVKRNKIRSITIPLLEKSDIKDRNVRREFINSIRRYSKKYKDIIFSFEFECEPKEILEVAKVSENFRITYDTGNITSFAGASAYRKYIKALIGRIDAIHLKDKSRNGTVFPGSGDTPFAGIFALLKTLKYDGPLTIQTARGRSGDELNTSVRHFKFFKKYL